jgi:hypothetical protein
MARKPVPNVTPALGERFNRFLDQYKIVTGIDLEESHRTIPDGMTFRQWCERLALPTPKAPKGLLVDGKPFKLDDRPAMAWIYDQIPHTEDDAFRLVLVIMKCAQVGFTVMEILAAIYLGLRFGPATIGMFLPDMNLAGVKSTERFMPMVRSVPDVHKLMTQDAPDGTGRKTGEGNVNRRRIDKALYIFSWTSGRSTTESIPMDVVCFDEVQNMTNEQIEKTGERLSASQIRFMLMGSTANWPEADIDLWYRKGSQHRFNTVCPTCGESAPLDNNFPNCIRWDAERRFHRYVCTQGHWIDDTQNGRWIAENPDADAPIDPTIPRAQRPLRIRSIHFPQMLSPTIAAGEILDAYGSAEDMKNFYNRKLGKPYLDPSQVPVTLAHLKACEDAGIAAGVVWKTRARNTYMGIDQMGNFNVHVIKERLPDGRQAVIHVEETYDADPFMRSSELMNLYGVAVCVVEINPNYNDAKRFANRHKGKVFICDSFGSLKEGMLHWGDAPRLDVSERRTDEEERDRFTVRIDQYKCMDTSMAKFTAKVPLCVFPDRKALTQVVKEKGQEKIVEILPRCFHHFTKTALVAERDDEDGTNKYRRVVKKIGIDPHFSYANLLCDVAWSRSHGTSQFIIPEHGQKAESMSRAEEMGMPGLPVHVVQMIEIRTQKDTCGHCTGFNADRGMCEERELLVQATDAKCALYTPRQN